MKYGLFYNTICSYNWSLFLTDHMTLFSRYQRNLGTDGCDLAPQTDVKHKRAGGSYLKTSKDVGRIKN